MRKLAVIYASEYVCRMETASYDGNIQTERFIWPPDHLTMQSARELAEHLSSIGDVEANWETICVRMPHDIWLAGIYNESIMEAWNEQAVKIFQQHGFQCPQGEVSRSGYPVSAIE